MARHSDRWPYCPGCHNASFSTRHRGIVPPSGLKLHNHHSRILFIGEAPAKNEDREGIPFVGATGKETNRFYLPSAGLHRPNTAFANAMMCSLKGYRNPKPEQAKVCADFHLPNIIKQVNPQITVLLGAVACHLSERKIDLEVDHGIPFVGKLYNWVGPILPMYHPAAGMRDDFLQTQLQFDFPMLKRMWRDGIEEHPLEFDDSSLDYGVSTTDTIEDDLARCDPHEFAIDTEVDAHGNEANPLDPPYMLSYSGAEGFARVIMADDTYALHYLFEWVQRSRWIILHNSMFDMPVLRRMNPGDWNIEWDRVRDTMVDAYHSRTLAQGLKTLAYRLLGYRMSDYLDVVTPYALRPQLRWLDRIVSYSGQIKQPYLMPRQWKLPRKADNLISDSLNKGVDPQKRFVSWPEEDQQTAQDYFGDFPWKSIIRVPRDEAVIYACGDADITRRIKPLIAKRQAALRLRVSQGRPLIGELAA